ncbi:MAG: N-acetyltransferase family protein [Vicinamibacterales bacterium]
MHIVTCTHERHARAIVDIFNEAILNSTALYDYMPRPLESMADWFQQKADARYPVIGIENAEGSLLGFASYGQFRVRPAYKYTVEHSVYIHCDHRGRGLGPLLMQRLIEAATAQDYHVMVGGIDASNAASIRLHERLGFSHSGTIQQAGFKFGRWLDLAFYQLILSSPRDPRDG